MKSIIKEVIRDLRKNCTKSEKIFWESVRNRKLKNRKFFRQYPITFDINDQKRFFIADFYCYEKKLVVEIDGGIHEKQKEYDALRTDIINHLGIKVIRFKNDEIMHNLDSVISKLLKYL